MRSDSLELWRGRIAAKEASGLSARAWCAQNGITPNLFYSWKHSLSRMEKPAAGSMWLPAILCDEGVAADPGGEGCIVVRVGGAEIEVHNGCNLELLRCVLHALGAQPC